MKSNSTNTILSKYFIIICVQHTCLHIDKPFGGGGGINPNRIFSCFSFSSALLRCILIFFLSFFVKNICSCGTAFGSAKIEKVIALIHTLGILYKFRLWSIAAYQWLQNGLNIQIKL